jgi:hypothetical protein
MENQRRQVDGISARLGVQPDAIEQIGDYYRLAIGPTLEISDFEWFVRVYPDSLFDLAAHLTDGRDPFYLPFEPNSTVPFESRLEDLIGIVRRLRDNRSRVRIDTGILFFSIYADVHEAGKWAPIGAISTFRFSGPPRSYRQGVYYCEPCKAKSL